MKSELTFEDWVKFKLVVGEVIGISKSDVRIDIGGKILKTNKKGNLEKGDKIIVCVQEENLIIPLIDGSVIIPEKDIGVGAKIR